VRVSESGEFAIVFACALLFFLIYSMIRIRQEPAGIEYIMIAAAVQRDRALLSAA